VLIGTVDAVWFGSEVLVEVGAVAELVYHRWRRGLRRDRDEPAAQLQKFA